MNELLISPRFTFIGSRDGGKKAVMVVKQASEQFEKERLAYSIQRRYTSKH